LAITAGLKVRIDEIIGAITRTRLMSLGLIASFVLVPLVTVLLLHVFHAPPLVAAAFLIVSVCAGAPFSVPGTTIARGDVPAHGGVFGAISPPGARFAQTSSRPFAGCWESDHRLSRNHEQFLISQIIPLAFALWFHDQRPDLAARLAKPSEIIQWTSMFFDDDRHYICQVAI
jgi:hypothetical protein